VLRKTCKRADNSYGRSVEMGNREVKESDVWHVAAFHTWISGSTRFPTNQAAINCISNEWPWVFGNCFTLTVRVLQLSDEVRIHI